MKTILKCLSILCLFVSVNANAQTLEEQIIEAIKDTEKGDFEMAISKYNSLIEKYPEAPMLYVLKGEAYSQLKRRYTVDTVAYNNAIESFNMAISLDTTFFAAYRSRAVINIFHQRFDKAVNDFAMAIKYSPTKEDLFNSLTDRGAAYLYLEDYDKALLDYNEAKKLNPNSLGIYGNLAILYKRKGDLKEAVIQCEKGLELAPDDETLLNNLGLINMDQEQYQKAEESYDKILAKNSGNPLALSNRGFARTKLKKYTLAMEDLNQSISIYPENSYAFKNRAILFLELNQPEKACIDLKESKRLGYQRMYGDEVEQLLRSNCK